MEEKILEEQLKMGVIDDLQFLLGLVDLAPIYLNELKKRGEIPTLDSAKKWLREYEIYERIGYSDIRSEEESINN